MKFPKKRASLTAVSLTLSLFTLAAYHVPFFRFVLGNVEGGANGVLITASLGVLMLALDFSVYALVLFLGRFVGKCVLACTFLCNALGLYFINTYEVLITHRMMGNVFNTRYSEASGFFSWSAVPYLLLLGVVPCVYLFARRFDYGSGRRLLVSAGAGVGLSVAVALANMPNWPWIDRNATTLGSIVLPWSYTVNSVRYWNSVQKRNRRAIPLPDARIATESRDVCVLVIGESARRANFSLYGYGRPTNPLLACDSVTALEAEASATYTTAGVKAILDHAPTGKLYETLPDYLHRTGVDVVWRSSNWGEPPLHIDRYSKVRDLKERYPGEDERYDGILLAGLKEEIEASDSTKMFVVLHTGTSHGPTYYKKYPAGFERFRPVCTTVEMSKADRGELMNAYDNTIVYTDYLVHSVIETLRSVPGRRSCVVFVSDHGESLGEGNLYMHGVPMFMAPKEQIEIPFIVWTSDGTRISDAAAGGKVGHYHVFHSLLGFLGIESPAYDSSRDIFAREE